MRNFIKAIIIMLALMMIDIHVTKNEYPIYVYSIIAIIFWLKMDIEDRLDALEEKVRKIRDNVDYRAWEVL